MPDSTMSSDVSVSKDEDFDMDLDQQSKCNSPEWRRVDINENGIPVWEEYVTGEPMEYSKYAVFVEDEDWRDVMDETPELDIMEETIKLAKESVPWDTGIQHKYIKVQVEVERKKKNDKNEKEEEYEQKTNCKDKGNKGKTKAKYISSDGEEDEDEVKAQGVLKVLKKKQLEKKAKYQICGNEKGHEYKDKEDEETDFDDLKDTSSTSGDEDSDTSKEGKEKKLCWVMEEIEGYDAAIEKRLLRDVDDNMNTVLEHWDTCEPSEEPAIEEDQYLPLTPLTQDSNEDSDGDALPSKFEWTYEDRMKLLEIEDMYHQEQIKSLHNVDTMEERCKKYHQNYEMAGLAQVAINRSTVEEYFECCHDDAEPVILKPQHLVTEYKMKDHPWIEKDITRDEFLDQEAEMIKEAEAQWLQQAKDQNTMNSVKELGHRYSDLFATHLKNVLTSYWQDIDKIHFHDWLLACPFMMQKDFGSSVLRGCALPKFWQSAINVLFQYWLEISPVKEVLNLKNRVSQWICMLEDPSHCVMEVTYYMKHLKIISRRKNELFTPPTHEELVYASEEYELDLWSKMLYEKYIDGRKDWMKRRSISARELTRLEEPVRSDILPHVQIYDEPSLVWHKKMNTFLKQAGKTSVLANPSFILDGSSDSEEEKDNDTEIDDDKEQEEEQEVGEISYDEEWEVGDGDGETDFNEEEEEEVKEDSDIETEDDKEEEEEDDSEIDDGEKEEKKVREDSKKITGNSEEEEEDSDSKVKEEEEDIYSKTNSEDEEEEEDIYSKTNSEDEEEEELSLFKKRRL